VVERGGLKTCTHVYRHAKKKRVRVSVCVCVKERKIDHV
jgi:hypothetical protein